jgi:hypothetical protein
MIETYQHADEYRRTGCAQTTVQIRKEVRTKHERRTDSSSHSRGRVADFNFVTQQNVELRMTFHLSLKSTMKRSDCQTETRDVSLEA